MLKTFINGNSVNLTPVGKPPVTFVNGAKKSLVKGITFINGEKVILWDSNKLQINYIDLTSVSGADRDFPIGCFANVDKVIYSSGNNVNRLNTGNFANVTLDAQVSMGSVLGFSSVDSTDSTAVYYACNSSSSNRTFNQLNIGVGTGEVIASNSQSYTGTWNVRTAGYMGKWINANITGNPPSNRYIWVKDGDATLYNYQALRTSGSLSGYYPGCPNFTKIDANTLVGRLQIYGGTTGIGEFTDSGYVAKGGLEYVDFLTDGNTVACAGNGFGLYTRNTSGNYVVIKENSGVSGHTDRLVGKCRGNYYVIAVPDSSGDSGYYLRVFDGSGDLVETIELTGLSGFLSPYASVVVPQLSKTGYLVFGCSACKKLVVIQCY